MNPRLQLAGYVTLGEIFNTSVLSSVGWDKNITSLIGLL